MKFEFSSCIPVEYHEDIKKLISMYQFDPELFKNEIQDIGLYLIGKQVSYIRGMQKNWHQYHGSDRTITGVLTDFEINLHSDWLYVEIFYLHQKKEEDSNIKNVHMIEKATMLQIHLGSELISVHTYVNWK